MAIVEMQETFQSRSYSLDDTRNRDYTRTFQVLTDSRTTDPNEIRLSAIVPRLWTPYIGANGTADFGSWCRGLNIRQDVIDPYLWHVEAKYSSKIERPDINKIENPLLRPADISWSTTSVMRPVETERDGNGITNSSGEKFDPPPEVEDLRLLLTISRNQLLYDALAYLDFVNTVNSKAWLNFKPGQVRCMRIDGQRQFENGLLFWRANFEFQIRKGTEKEDHKDAWALRLLDRGFMELVALEPRLMRDKNTGALLSSPALLDGKGHRLPAGDPAVFLTFYHLKEKDFREILPL